MYGDIFFLVYFLELFTAPVEEGSLSAIEAVDVLEEGFCVVVPGTLVQVNSGMDSNSTFLFFILNVIFTLKLARSNAQIG